MSSCVKLLLLDSVYTQVSFQDIIKERLLLCGYSDTLLSCIYDNVLTGTAAETTVGLREGAVTGSRFVAVYNALAAAWPHENDVFSGMRARRELSLLKLEHSRDIIEYNKKYLEAFNVARSHGKVPSQELCV